jgi:hypothetical protein
MSRVMIEAVTHAQRKGPERALWAFRRAQPVRQIVHEIAGGGPP